MKTTTYTLTVLALSIQVMVNGQTQDNQARKIRMDIFGAQPSAEREKQLEGPVTYMNKLEETVKEADDLIFTTEKLKNELVSLQKKYITKKIEISLLKANISYEKFNLNKITIQNLVKKVSQQPLILNRSENLTSEAEYAIKLAKEIREEANAQFTAEAQLGEMSNAEEKEFFALSKQQEAITLLTQHAPLTILAVKEQITLTTPIENTQVKTDNYKLNNTLTELTKQAFGIRNTAKQLRDLSENKQGYEKEVLVSEATIMDKEYTQKQIEISMLNSKITQVTFYDNRKLIENLLNSINNDAITQQAQLINEEAEYNFRIAKEMREEANAQHTEMAKLAEMTNAEEKEIVALNKQQQTFTTLNQVAAN